MNGDDITVMFSITRNLYEYAPGVIQNLIDTNPLVYRIYLFIEDDEFPYKLDKRVRTININNCPKFIKGGPNEGNPWTYMAYTRCFVSQILLEDKIIYLDLDLYFNKGLDKLWNTDFEGNYLCGVAESTSTIHDNKGYINTGVLLLNLRAMRENHIDIKICKLIQNKKLHFPDQDAINKICKGKIKYISRSFNITDTTYKSPTYGISPVVFHTTFPKLWNRDSNFYKKWKTNTEKALREE